MTQRMTIGILALFSTAVLSASQAPTPGDAPRPAPGQETPRPPQTPPTQTTPATPSAPAGQAAAAGQMTMAGCLYREGSDWILADASMAGQAKPGATAGATGTTGSAAAGGRYKIASLPDDRLKDHTGKRVEVSGKLGAGRPAAGGAGAGAAGGAAGAGAGATLQEFQAASIKEVSGNCPATPSASPAK